MFVQPRPRHVFTARSRFIGQEATAGSAYHATDEKTCRQELLARLPAETIAHAAHRLNQPGVGRVFLEFLP